MDSVNGVALTFLGAGLTGAVACYVADKPVGLWWCSTAAAMSLVLVVAWQFYPKSSSSGGETRPVTPDFVHSAQPAPDVHSIPVPAAPDTRSRDREFRSGLAQGWTIHKRGEAYTITFIMDTSSLNEPVASAMNKQDGPVPVELTAKVQTLWNEVSNQVPTAKPAETPYGIVKGQELVEHLNHFEKKQGDTLEWTYEIMLNGSGITPKPQVFERLSLDKLSQKSRDTVGELDALTTRTVNQRYIEAIQRLSK